MQEAAAPIFVAQLVDQLGGVAALGRAQGVGVPFGGIAVAHGHVGGLAAHGQAHVGGHQIGVNPFAQRQHAAPLLIGVGLGDARRFVDAGHLHVVAEIHFGFVHHAFDGRGTGRLRRAGQRHVAFAGHQAGGRVQPDPAGAGQVDLAPGVQVGEIDFGAAGAVQRLHIRFELDQVARDKARRQAAVAQELHQQPARITAGAAGVPERLLRRLHTRLHADQVADVLLQLLVDADQEVDGALLAQVHRLQVGRKQGRGRIGDQIGGELDLEFLVVLERELLGIGFQEEVEGVVHRHFHDQIHRDLEFTGFLWKHQACLVVGERVLLPVDEMPGRFDLERIRDHARAAVRSRPQPDHLWPERHQAVVFVVGHMVQGGVDRHGLSRWADGRGNPDASKRCAIGGVVSAKWLTPVRHEPMLNPNPPGR